MTTEIKLDYDFKGKKQLKQVFIDNQYIFYKLKLKLIDLKLYETKKGYHIYITIKNNIPDLDIIILQLLMQSDFQRELFNYQRVKSGLFKKKWNVLFSEKQDYNNKIISKEKHNKKLEDEIKDIMLNFDFNLISKDKLNRIKQNKKTKSKSPTR